MVTALHAGPKQRGTERKQFKFRDGSVGDVYRCVLLAITGDPSSLSFRYDEMLKRATALCDGESPVGSSVLELLVQMAKVSVFLNEAPVFGLDEDVLDIVEAYFFIFLRCSPHLSELAK